MLIETTGLADPAPIIHTLMTAPVISNRYALDGIITTVDAVNAENEFNKHKESVKQVAVADRIVITKSDLVQPNALKSVTERLNQLNPGSPKELVVMGQIEPDKLFDAGLYDPKTKSMDVQRWLRDEAYTKHSGDHEHHHHNVNRHDDAINAFCMTREKPIDWEAFVAGLEGLGPVLQELLVGFAFFHHQHIDHLFARLWGLELLRGQLLLELVVELLLGVSILVRG